MNRTSLLFLFITIFFSFLYTNHATVLKKTVYGDGAYYYSWLRSLVIDRDSNFQNEYAFFHISAPTTPKGMPGNKYAIGPALLWLPTFLSVYSLFHGSGFEFVYQFAVGLTSVGFVITGLVFLYRLLARLQAKRQTIIITILLTSCATNLLFYGAVDTVNSHGLSFFAATVFLVTLVEKTNPYVSGVALGILALIRPQDIVYGLIIPCMLPKRSWPKVLASFAVIFSIQLVAWNTLYGKWWVSPYTMGGERFDILHAHIWEVLFSPNHGLFLWHPILIAASFGLFLGIYRKKARSMYLPFTLVFLAEVITVASWIIWWQGASFGGRMFVSSIPLLSTGLIQTEHITQSKFALHIFYLAAALSVVGNCVLVALFLLN